MSNSFYSDSFTSGDYKPSNYTDFSSSSFGNYTSDQNSSYKKFDDYSSGSNTYSSFQPSSNSSQSNFSNFDSYANRQNFDNHKNSDTTQQYQNDSLSFQDAYFNTPQSTQQQQQVSAPVKPNPLQQQSNVGTQPMKPMEKFTVRDVLDLPPLRQQYLKSLPIENLRQQPEYKVLLKRQSVLLGIVDYYEKIIPDNEFNNQVKSLKRGKDIKETLWLTSIIGYLVMSGRLQSSQSSFKGIFKGRAHFIIPLTLTGLMIFDNRNTRAKTSLLLRDSKNLSNIDIAMRKFICDTKQQQRVQIFGQS